MIKIALSVPGPGGQVTINNPTGFKSNFTDLGGVVSGVLQIGIYIAFVLAMAWMAWGVFQYIVAGGNKENLARARARITWAIVGLVIVILAFSLQRLVGEIFQPQTVNIKQITPP